MKTEHNSTLSMLNTFQNILWILCSYIIEHDHANMIFVSMMFGFLSHTQHSFDFGKDDGDDLSIKFFLFMIVNWKHWVMEESYK